ncbi:MAG TPA: isopentenyl phosphate kinase [Candidatus Nitrosocosmicus sp.]|nr:isopentenyl phosphate kinase [Candidatus Nitrosocosmicus sp.]
MIDSNVVLIKMGGSVVTFKDRPLMPNGEGIEGIAKVLLELKKNFKILVVHGGGSFGHYWSVKYDMHTKPFPYSDEGIALVHESMIKLNHIITDEFIKLGLRPYSFHPSSFMSKGNADVNKVRELAELTIDNELIPVTFGDVIHTRDNNFSILSGDTIMSILGTALHPRYCIFTTNVDGLYGELDKKNIIPEIFLNEEGKIINTDSRANSNIETSTSSFDVTGGMKRKITEAIPIVRSGSPVHLISGFRPERILDIVNNRDYVGTCVRLKSTSQLIR